VLANGVDQPLIKQKGWPAGSGRRGTARLRRLMVVNPRPSTYAGEDPRGSSVMMLGCGSVIANVTQPTTSADDKTSAKRISIICGQPSPVDSASWSARSPDPLPTTREWARSRRIPRRFVDGKRSGLDVETTLFDECLTRSPKCDVVLAQRESPKREREIAEHAERGPQLSRGLYATVHVEASTA